jgi:uncharacterized protein (TIGR00255 family)
VLKSMTGFGRGEAVGQGWHVKVEMKSVNHRYLDLTARIGRDYTQLEETIRRIVQNRLARGRVEVSVFVEELEPMERTVKVNMPLLRGYLQALEQVQSELPVKQDLTIDHVLTLPVFEQEDPAVDWENLALLTEEAVTAAIGELEQMRALEGAQLQEDLAAKLDYVSQLVDTIEEAAPHVVEAYRARLRERLKELLDGTSLTEERFLAEVAIFADKSGIDEEIVRFHSHLKQFARAMDSGEPVGRKLDFLLQEMNREINTIGAKANSIDIANAVVEIKSVLEKIREQVQNIE